MMKTNKEIKNKVDSTFEALDAIEQVNVSPFFKDKTMQRLFSEKEEKRQVIWSWFTPRIQLATLVCVIVLNVLAASKVRQETYNDNISEFASSYGLSTSNENSLLN